MLDILKKKSRKSFIMRAVITLILAVVMLVVTKFAIIDVITGPAKVDITASPDTYEGKYVTLEVQNILTDYVEHSTTTTNSKTGSKRTSIDGNSYIVFNTVDDYANNTSTWYYFSIYEPEKMQDKLYGLIDDTWEYWADETYTVAPPETVTVTGTWTKLTGSLEQYYQETLDEMGIAAGDYDKIYFYTIDTAKLGGVTVGVFWVLNALALISLIGFIVSIVGILSTGYAKNINKYLHNNSNVSLATIESDFSSAHPIGKNAWVGKKWTIYMSGPKAYILENKDFVWAYYFKRTGRNAVSQMRIFTTDKKMYTISLSETETQEALKYYGEEQPQMVIGYSSDLEKTYEKNFSEFLNLKFNPAKVSAQTDPYFNGSYYGTDGSGQEDPAKTNNI